MPEPDWTCEEFRAAVTGPPVTEAGRVLAMRRHHAGCESCRAWLKQFRETMDAEAIKHVPPVVLEAAKIVGLATAAMALAAAQAAQGLPPSGEPPPRLNCTQVREVLLHTNTCSACAGSEVVRAAEEHLRQCGFCEEWRAAGMPGV